MNGSEVISDEQRDTRNESRDTSDELERRDGREMVSDEG